MTAAYQKELEFMRRALERMRLQVRLYRPGDPLEGLGFCAGPEVEAEATGVFQLAARLTQHRTIYKLMDQFLCRYVYFHLPGAAPSMTVIIGPYLTLDLTRNMVLELAEQLGLPMHMLPQLLEYYASLPVVHDPSVIMAVVSTFGEVLWGGETFDMVDVDYEQHHSVPYVTSENAPIEQKDVLQIMKQMEERYAFENELMEIVAKGLTHRAEGLMSSVSQLSYQQRLPDPLRNIKNYCIICNTLLRKAAQQGGVHPIHLDRLSGYYARMIENAPTFAAGSALISEMLRAYCRLVRTHNGSAYSAVVQKAKTYIEANLSSDLSLHMLAKLMRVTPGYLSTIFRRETGETPTGYINGQRMKAALHLLRSTKLQVQTIAQLCGCSDPNYFSRLFKRHYGMPPGAIRKEALHPGGSGEQ